MSLIPRAQLVTSALLVALLQGCFLVPGNDQLQTETTEQTTVVKGVPGGVMERITKITAKVKDIDHRERWVLLEDESGNRKRIDVPPEAINFQQVEKGDRVTVTYAEELIIYLSEVGAPATSELAAAALASAPAGNKPRVVVADVRSVTATVTDINFQDHTATLKFTDGSIRVVPVREDVELKKSQIGREVVFQSREAIAVSVEKQ